MKDVRWLMTYTGRIYWPFSPNAHDVRIEDIAHGLSNLCRYGGQCRLFYSVAEHSVLMSYMVPQAQALEALLHDGSEAYCGDVILPIKRSLEEYTEMERLNMQAVRKAFALDPEEHPNVSRADRQIVSTEYETLFGPIPEYLDHAFPYVKDPFVKLELWCPTIAEHKFLQRYHELVKVRVS